MKWFVYVNVAVILLVSLFTLLKGMLNSNDDMMIYGAVFIVLNVVLGFGFFGFNLIKKGLK